MHTAGPGKLHADRCADGTRNGRGPTQVLGFGLRRLRDQADRKEKTAGNLLGLDWQSVSCSNRHYRPYRHVWIELPNFHAVKLWSWRF